MASLIKITYVKLVLLLQKQSLLKLHNTQKVKGRVLIVASVLLPV